MTRRFIIFGGIFGLSFVFLILHLNFNVKTFRLTQQLQDVTLQIYDISSDVDAKELEYLTRTRPHKIYEYASNELGMIRQKKVNVFTNQSVDVR